MTEKTITCCVHECTTNLDKNYWDNQYKNRATGWDLGEVSPALKHIIDNIKDLSKRILIPGCGNAYEAMYLIRKGFRNITLIDISPTLVFELKAKFASFKEIEVIEGDFFQLDSKFDIILEQTFFCALPPFKRQHYVYKMHDLLCENGSLIGVLFNRQFEKSPPFGGSQDEYEQLFKNAFNFLHLEICTNSVIPRADSELFISFSKNNLSVKLYNMSGLSCNSCAIKVQEELSTIKSIENISISTNFKQMLIVSKNEIPINILQNVLAYNNNLTIQNA
jgi:SAM-dependent methyltransferase